MMKSDEYQDVLMAIVDQLLHPLMSIMHLKVVVEGHQSVIKVHLARPLMAYATMMMDVMVHLSVMAECAC